MIYRRLLLYNSHRYNSPIISKLYKYALTKKIENFIEKKFENSVSPPYGINLKKTRLELNFEKSFLGARLRYDKKLLCKILSF